MHKLRVITIIGSRKTPKDILESMRVIAEWCTNKGVIVRSGKAGGADAAAIYGCMDAYTKQTAVAVPEMYVPWSNFGSMDMTNAFDVDMGSNPAAKEIAKSVHPAWQRCSQGAQKLHTRNVGQILGKDLATPSDIVLYWCEEKHGKPTGGTATAVNLAGQHGCICINMLHDSWQQLLKPHLAAVQEAYKLTNKV